MTTASTAQDWIARLALIRHPEGGWYRETYRSREHVPAAALPSRFGGARVFGTAIYYLLQSGERSALHRIKSDEVWHHYAGDAVTVKGWYARDGKRMINAEGVKLNRTGREFDARSSYHEAAAN